MNVIVKFLFSIYLGVWLGINDLNPFDSTWIMWWSLVIPLNFAIWCF